VNELTADLFVSLDGFASGVDVGPFFGATAMCRCARWAAFRWFAAFWAQDSSTDCA
jgi:hypothetical protein